MQISFFVRIASRLWGESSSTNSTSSANEQKKHQVTTQTLEKWQRENNRDLQFQAWLGYDAVPRDNNCLSVV